MKYLEMLTKMGLLFMIIVSAHAIELSNSDKSKQWNDYLNTLNDSDKACVKIGIDKKNLIINTIDPNVKIPSFDDTAVKEIFNLCDKFNQIKLRKDVQCNLSDGKKGICNDYYCYEVNGEKFSSGRNNKLPTGAMKALFDGININACLIETDESKQNRLTAEDKSTPKNKSTDTSVSKQNENNTSIISVPPQNTQLNQNKDFNAKENKNAKNKNNENTNTSDIFDEYNFLLKDFNKLVRISPENKDGVEKLENFIRKSNDKSAKVAQICNISYNLDEWFFPNHKEDKFFANNKKIWMLIMNDLIKKVNLSQSDINIQNKTITDYLVYLDKIDSNGEKTYKPKLSNEKFFDGSKFNLLQVWITNCNVTPNILGIELTKK